MEEAFAPTYTDLLLRQYQYQCIANRDPYEPQGNTDDERPASDNVLDEEAAIAAVMAAHIPSQHPCHDSNEAIEDEILRRKTTTEGQSFPYKLWHLINDESYQDVVHFSLDGQRIVFPDEDEFTDRVLARKDVKIFKTENLKSFVRQLNLYGFIKIQLKREKCFKFLHEHEQERDTWPDMVFEHPNFKKDRLDLLESLKRRCNIRPPKPEGNSSKDSAHHLYSSDSTAAKVLMGYQLEAQDPLLMQPTKRKLFTDKQRKTSKHPTPVSNQQRQNAVVDMSHMYQYQWPWQWFCPPPAMPAAYYNAPNQQQVPMSYLNWGSPTYHHPVTATVPQAVATAFLPPGSVLPTYPDMAAFTYLLPQQVVPKEEQDEKPAAQCHHHYEDQAPTQGTEEDTVEQNQVSGDAASTCTQQHQESEETPPMDGIEPLPSSSESQQSRISSDCGGGKVGILFSPSLDENYFQPFLHSSPS